MKHIMHIALTASILALSAGTAVAEEIKFKAPDISGRLNMMVEHRMDRLVREISEHPASLHVAEQVNNNVSLIPGTPGKESAYISKHAGS